MKASHRKDVIIARIIFAIICAALLAGIISLIVWLHGRNAGKNQTPETEITNNAPPADNSNLPPVTEQPLDEDGQSVWTSTDGVNFRAEPNTDSEILTVLVTGTDKKDMSVQTMLPIRNRIQQRRKQSNGKGKQ